MKIYRWYSSPTPKVEAPGLRDIDPVGQAETEIKDSEQKLDFDQTGTKPAQQEPSEKSQEPELQSKNPELENAPKIPEEAIPKVVENYLGFIPGNIQADPSPTIAGFPATDPLQPTPATQAVLPNGPVLPEQLQTSKKFNPHAVRSKFFILLRF